VRIDFRYNATEQPSGPKNLRAVLINRLRMQGLIVFDWGLRYPEAIAALGAWHAEGKLKLREDVRDGGIEAYPDVFNLLYTGGNFGKLMLRV
jgi:NADPH-dependent curcumin reductase CurA